VTQVVFGEGDQNGRVAAIALYNGTITRHLVDYHRYNRRPLLTVP